MIRTMIRAGLFLSLLLLSACASKPTYDTHIRSGHASMRPADEQRYQSALLQLGQGEIPKASQALATLAARYEDNPGLWLNLATAHYLAGDIDSASEALEQVELLAANLPQLHNLKGMIAVQRGDYQRAEECYRKAIELDDEQHNSHYNLALLYDIFYQDLAAALHHYRRYLSLIDFEDNETATWLRQVEAALAKRNQQ